MASLINQPVYINGKQGRYLGVCRFYGTTGFKDGVWVGVELDRPIGKNDVSSANIQSQQNIFIIPSPTVVVL